MPPQDANPTPSFGGFGFNLTAEAGIETVFIPLSAGFNLIGIPVGLTATTTSRDIAELVLGIPGASNAQIQAGPVISVLGWNVGSQIYDTWAAAVPSSGIFNLTEGGGYFVRVSQNGTLPFTGPPIPAPIQLDLKIRIQPGQPAGGDAGRRLYHANPDRGHHRHPSGERRAGPGRIGHLDPRMGQWLADIQHLGSRSSIVRYTQYSRERRLLHTRESGRDSQSIVSLRPAKSVHAPRQPQFMR